MNSNHNAHLNCNSNFAGLVAKLQSMGVRDVKFFFSTEALGSPREVKRKAGNSIRAYMRGACVDAGYRNTQVEGK